MSARRIVQAARSAGASLYGGCVTVTTPITKKALCLMSRPWSRGDIEALVSRRFNLLAVPCERLRDFHERVVPVSVSCPSMALDDRLVLSCFGGRI